MFCIGHTRAWLDELNEDILGIVEFHEVLEVLPEKTKF